MVLSYVTASLGADDVASLIATLEPVEVDHYLAVAIDLLGRLMSDGSVTLIVDGSGARFVGLDEPDADGEFTVWPLDAVDSAGAGVVAGIVHSVRGQVVHHGGDGDR